MFGAKPCMFPVHVFCMASMSLLHTASFRRFKNLVGCHMGQPWSPIDVVIILMWSNSHVQIWATLAIVSNFLPGTSGTSGTSIARKRCKRNTCNTCNTCNATGADNVTTHRQGPWSNMTTTPVEPLYLLGASPGVHSGVHSLSGPIILTWTLWAFECFWHMTTPQTVSLSVCALYIRAHVGEDVIVGVLESPLQNDNALKPSTDPKYPNTGSKPR